MPAGGPYATASLPSAVPQAQVVGARASPSGYPTGSLCRRTAPQGTLRRAGVPGPPGTFSGEGTSLRETSQRDKTPRPGTFCAGDWSCPTRISQTQVHTQNTAAPSPRVPHAPARPACPQGGGERPPRDAGDSGGPGGSPPTPMADDLVPTHPTPLRKRWDCPSLGTPLLWGPPPGWSGIWDLPTQGTRTPKLRRWPELDPAASQPQGPAQWKAQLLWPRPGLWAQGRALQGPPGLMWAGLAQGGTG